MPADATVFAHAQPSWLDLTEHPPFVPEGEGQLHCYVSWYGAATGRQAIFRYEEPQWAFYLPDIDRYEEIPELTPPDIYFPLVEVPRTRLDLGLPETPGGSPSGGSDPVGGVPSASAPKRREAPWIADYDDLDLLLEAADIIVRDPVRVTETRKAFFGLLAAKNRVWNFDAVWTANIVFPNGIEVPYVVDTADLGRIKGQVPTSDEILVLALSAAAGNEYIGEGWDVQQDRFGCTRLFCEVFHDLFGTAVIGFLRGDRLQSVKGADDQAVRRDAGMRGA
jgi:hypothetical protein